MVIVVVIASIVILAQSYIIYNLYNKFNVLVKEVETREQNAQNAITVLQFVQGLVVEAYAEMERIDKRGGFRSDDEVGFTFQALKEVVEQLKFFITKLTEEDSESSKTENQ